MSSTEVDKYSSRDPIILKPQEVEAEMKSEVSTPFSWIPCTGQFVLRLISLILTSIKSCLQSQINTPGVTKSYFSLQPSLQII